MSNKIETFGIIAMTTAAILASSGFVYSSVIAEKKIHPTDNKFTVTPKNEATDINGVFKAPGNYYGQPGFHEMDVTITLENSKIKSVVTEPKFENKTSLKMHEKFALEVNNIVRGKTLDESATIGVIAGASQTTEGFKEAVKAIQAQVAKK